MKSIRRQYGIACILLTAVCLLDFFTEFMEVLVSHTDTLVQLAAAGVFWKDGAPLVARLFYHLTVPIGHALLAYTAYRGHRGRSMEPWWEIGCGVCVFHWLWLLITHCVAVGDGINAMWYIDVFYAGVMVLFWVLYGASGHHYEPLVRNRRLLEYGAIMFKVALLGLSLVVMYSLGDVSLTALGDWLLHVVSTAGLCAGLLLLGAEEDP